MNFFDFLNSINDHKRDLIKEDPHSEKDYNAFMINRGLSMFADTIMYANEMNKSSGIDKKWQYHFYLNGIPRKKRFSKWPKKQPTPDVLSLIMREYNYSEQKALAVLDLFSDEQLKQIQQSYYTGGNSKEYK